MSINLNAVRIVDNALGEIFLRNGTEIKKQTISLGKVFGNNIEIKTVLPKDSSLVLTNLDAYDPKTMEIKLVSPLQ